MMITANTVGFVLGVDNTVAFLKQVFGTLPGFVFLVVAIVVLSSAAHVMFEYRCVVRSTGPSPAALLKLTLSVYVRLQGGRASTWDIAEVLKDFTI